MFVSTTDDVMISCVHGLVIVLNYSTVQRSYLVKCVEPRNYRRRDWNHCRNKENSVKAFTIKFVDQLDCQLQCKLAETFLV